MVFGSIVKEGMETRISVSIAGLEHILLVRERIILSRLMMSADLLTR